MARLIKLKDHVGRSLYVDPETVVGLRPSVIDGCTAILVQQGENETYTAAGTPDEVHAALYPQEPT